MDAISWMEEWEGKVVDEFRKQRIRMTDMKESFECTVLCTLFCIEVVGGILEWTECAYHYAGCIWTMRWGTKERRIFESSQSNKILIFDARFFSPSWCVTNKKRSSCFWNSHYEIDSCCNRLCLLSWKPRIACFHCPQGDKRRVWCDFFTMKCHESFSHTVASFHIIVESWFLTTFFEKRRRLYASCNARDEWKSTCWPHFDIAAARQWG